jgi:hypothetical protein
MEVPSKKEYQNRQSRKGCLTVLLLAIIIGSFFYFQGDEESAKTKTEIVSEKSQSVETEQPTEPRVVIEDENPAPVDENVEENKEKEEIVNEDVSSKEEVKSISIDELVKSYQNNQDQ